MNCDELKNVVFNSVGDFARNKFMRNPYDYLYESDLQADLFGIIREKVNATVFSGTIRIPNTSGMGKGIDCFNLNLIYTEYGYTKDCKWEPMDIVCLDPTKVVDLDEYKSDGHPNAKYEALWNQPLLVGIELKYSMWSKYCGVNACVRDLQKMQRYKVERNKYSPNFSYLVICFVQDEWSMARIVKNPIGRLVGVGSMCYNRCYFVSRENFLELIL